MLDSIRHLYDHGLIESVHDGSERRRFRLAARQRVLRAELEASGELPRLRERIVDWMWEHAVVLDKVFELPRFELQWFLDRMDCLSMAVQFTRESSRTDDRHDLLALALVHCHLHLGQTEEGNALIERTLSRNPGSRHWADLSLLSAWTKQADDNTDLLSLAQTALPRARSAGSQGQIIRTLTTLALAYSGVGAHRLGSIYLRRATMLARQVDDFTSALCAHAHAWVLLGARQPLEASATLATTLPEFEHQPLRRSSATSCSWRARWTCGCRTPARRRHGYAGPSRST
ncbi:hypothetical protein [Micromonospora sp. ATCC 39149]|uniref:hypothetical protein n=1 Tax=Micromonospora sp. (strain ATCC 39149 / NRRL 15099 / SCC 1413) TaxID=219305 RepID=UPI0005665DCA|nr:hypothetical protein [Micromonospora sp. ATCC 39149]